MALTQVKTQNLAMKFFTISQRFACTFFPFLDGDTVLWWAGFPTFQRTWLYSRSGWSDWTAALYFYFQDFFFLLHLETVDATPFLSHFDLKLKTTDFTETSVNQPTTTRC